MEIQRPTWPLYRFGPSSLALYTPVVNETLSNKCVCSSVQRLINIKSILYLLMLLEWCQLLWPIFLRCSSDWWNLWLPSIRILNRNRKLYIFWTFMSNHYVFPQNDNVTSKCAGWNLMLYNSKDTFPPLTCNQKSTPKLLWREKCS